MAAPRDDAPHVRRALRLARRGWGTTAPNPMVGAVVVRDGEIVGEGFHARYGGAHAEVVALGAAGERARGATVYVSLEPCDHHGKTPPCSEALIAAGVRRVVAAVADPSQVAAGGAERLRAAGIDVTVGVDAGAARELNAPFFHAAANDALPWVTLKLALSIDGAIADHRHGPAWLTGAGSRSEVHRLRANSDAIAVGIGTALADDPLLTVRAGTAPRVPPVRVVFDRRARLPLASRLMRTLDQAPVAVVCDDATTDGARALADAGARVIAARTIDDALRALRRDRAVRSLFVEGGAGLASALWSADRVDRLITFQAPVVLGRGALSAFGSAPPVTADRAPRLRVVRRRAFDRDLMTIYAVHELESAECSPG